MIYVDSKECIGCGSCVTDCFLGNMKLINNKAEVINDACLNCGHCIAVCPKGAVSIKDDEYEMEEVIEYDPEQTDIKAEHLLNFIKFRRTIRQFKDKPVEDEKIAKIIEAGRYTQTGSNAQDVSYIVVKDCINKVKELALETLKKAGEGILKTQNIGENYKRYASMWIDMYQDYKADEKKDRLFFNAPVVILVLANSGINGGLASSNMELMTNTLGLGTFFSGFFIRAVNQSDKLKELLGMKDGKELVSCMIIGYPNVKYLRTVPRKEAVVSFI